MQGHAQRDRASAAFHQAMLDVYAMAKRDIGYNATRFLQMVTNKGGVETARQLLRGAATSEGFEVLWEHGRLDLSVEAHVLLPWYLNLFSEVERDEARRRLVEHGFDVDHFNDHQSASAPAWGEEDDEATFPSAD